MVYIQHVEQLHVMAAALPLTAINSGGPFGTLRTDRAAEFTASGF